MQYNVREKTVMIMGISVSKYKCIHCSKIVERESNKKWIKSFCISMDKRVRLQLIKEE